MLSPYATFNNTGGLVDYYKAEVLSHQDYYPGGIGQSNRRYTIVAVMGFQREGEGE